MTPAIFSRDIGTDNRRRVRLTIHADRPDVIDLRLVEALGSFSGVFAPTGRGVAIPVGDLPDLFHGLHAAREALDVTAQADG